MVITRLNRTEGYPELCKLRIASHELCETAQLALRSWSFFPSAAPVRLSTPAPKAGASTAADGAETGRGRGPQNTGVSPRQEGLMTFLFEGRRCPIGKLYPETGTVFRPGPQVGEHGIIPSGVPGPTLRCGSINVSSPMDPHLLRFGLTGPSNGAFPVVSVLTDLVRYLGGRRLIT